MNEHIVTSKLLEEKITVLKQKCSISNASCLHSTGIINASVQSTAYFLFRYENLSGKTMSRSKLVETFQHHKSAHFWLETALRIIRFWGISPPVLRSIRAPIREHPLVALFMHSTPESHKQSQFHTSGVQTLYT